MSPAGFFDHRREWSRWKHRLLKSYLGKWVNILGPTHRIVYYIDGFAGAGKYLEPAEDGSPVIAARLASGPPPNRQTFALRCINVEPESFDELVTATAEFGHDVVENRKGTFGTHLPDILTTIGSKPALFFLDPYGVKGMEWDVVSRVVGRSRTEVLLKFPITKIDQHGGWIDSTDSKGLAFCRTLDQFFGTAEWRELYDSKEPREERMKRLTDLYMRRLAGAAHGFASKYEVYTIQGAMKYYIVHGTSAAIGCREMSDVVFHVSDDYRRDRVSYDEMTAGPQRLLFPVQLPTDAERGVEIEKALTGAMYGMKERRNRFTFVEIQDALIKEGWFGKAVPKHYRGAWNRLQKEKKAELLNVGPRGGITDESVIVLLP